MSYFGIDIGSYSIKFVKADGHDNHAKIKTVGSVYNSVGQVLPSDNHQLEQLAVLIKNGVRELGLSGQNCHLALPSSQAYMSIVSMPVLSDTELASAIQWEAEQHIPVNLSEINFEYDVIHRPDASIGSDAQMSVFLVGAPKNVVHRYIELLEMAGVEPIGLEPEMISMMRSFVNLKEAEGEHAKSGATLFCNFGALSSCFVIVKQGQLQATHNSNIGSLALTRAIEKGLGLDPARSEEYKRTYGLEANQLEGKVKNAIVPIFEGFIREVRKTQQYYVSKSPADNTVSRIVVSGGGANLPGLAAHLVESLSTEVVMGNPFSQFGTDSKLKLPEDVASYAVAVGLATKGF